MATLKDFLSIISLVLLQMSAVQPRHCSETTNLYLWKVEVTPPLYLFGTLHVPYDTIWDTLPTSVKTALSSSQDLFFELLSDNNTSHGLQNCQLLTKERTIDEVLPQELVTRLDRYFEKVRTLLPSWLDDRPHSDMLRGGQSYSDYLFNAITHDWKRKRPIWILTLISSLKEESIRVRTKPILDQFLEAGARGLDRNVAALEDVNDHCQPLNRLSDNDVEIALRIQLDYLESLPDGPPGTMERDLNAYICGDLRALIDQQPMLPLPPLSNISNITTSEIQALRKMESSLFSRLTTRRDRRITKKLTAFLQTNRTGTAFIAVGAGHLIGNKSIVDRLRKKGYHVHRIQLNETIEGPDLPEDFVSMGDPGASSTQPAILELKIPDPVLESPLERPSTEELSNIISRFFGDREERAVHIGPHRRLQSHSEDREDAMSSARTITNHQTSLLFLFFISCLIILSQLH